MTDQPSPSDSPHRHWFAFHRHPDWHGHCPLESFELDGVTYTDVNHWRCRRWHFHLPFKHRHTETGRWPLLRGVWREGRDD